MRYRPLDHTADVGIVVYGSTLEELFANAGYAMFDLMFDCASRSYEGPRHRVAVRAEAPDTSIEELLVAWLDELLFRSETDELAFCDVRVTRMGDGVVEGEAVGIPYAEVELRGPPIKAVTYHDLRVERTPTGYEATVVFDV